ncbi:CdaR family transcriptional regulator [Symbiobacterium thermophilum]|uniref:Carbohydrate diacid regulator n=1 Tax=Symbiobacterium thermophilum TaxID=2734 RepID=A0A953I3X4_SYMTR|nr:sugar diacid recognition domain-containing protein [Symbiobacterium thermophilum]MBY6277095.1 hypothetical protein [Symbiobacterium thermophilum]
MARGACRMPVALPAAGSQAGRRALPRWWEGITLRITSELAQPIADRAVTILQRNVNIMDEDGVIVASGDPTRIGSFHQAAAQVIRSNRRLDIYPGDEERWVGVRPGVNLPIQVDGRTVGVVGITGPPDQVGPFGELIREMVSLALMQRRAEELERVRLMARESFLRTLLTSKGPIGERMVQDAPLYDLSPDSAYQVLLCQGPRGTDGLSRIWAESEWLAQRLQRGGIDRITFAGPWNGLGVVIATDPPRDLSAVLLEALPKGFAVAGGLIGRGLVGLRRSYETALQSFAAGRLHGNPVALSAYRLRLSRLLTTLPPSEVAEFVAGMLGGLPAADSREGRLLRETVLAYAEEGLNSTGAADRLGIHRHTLVHRLGAIAERSGTDPRCWEGLLSLYLAIQLERLFGQSVEYGLQ